MEIFEWFSNLSRRYHLIIGLLLTMVIGYADYVTGYEFRMELFYLLPISYVTWFVGQRIGVLFSVLSVITIVYSDIMAGKRYSSHAVEFWNLAVYFVFYVIVTLLLKLRISLQQRENLIEELDNALRQNEELSAMLPVCANCKKFRDDREYRQGVESYISRHTKTEFSQSLCKECAEKLKPRTARP
jgi:K+-sensing histidine kinase KdpD